MVHQQDAYQELLNRIEELTKANEELQRSAYAVAHDLQEPLRSIGVYTELLQERTQGKLDEECLRLLQFVLGGVDRMKLLIQQMLEFARIGHEPGEKKVQVDTYAAAELALQDLRPVIDATGAKIHIESLPTVYASQEEILRLLENLISNAIKYHGEEPPEIRISASLNNEGWVFSVKDKGIGIDPQYHHQIFEMFQRLDSTSKQDGSGMGLATCKKIVERHSGRIWVESEPGKGSTFYFTLPAYLSAPAGAHQVSRAGQGL